MSTQPDQIIPAIPPQRHVDPQDTSGTGRARFVAAYKNYPIHKEMLPQLTVQGLAALPKPVREFLTLDRKPPLIESRAIPTDQVSGQSRSGSKTIPEPPTPHSFSPGVRYCANRLPALWRIHKMPVSAKREGPHEALLSTRLQIQALARPPSALSTGKKARDGLLIPREKPS